MDKIATFQVGQIVKLNGNFEQIQAVQILPNATYDLYKLRGWMGSFQTGHLEYAELDDQQEEEALYEIAMRPFKI